MTINLATVTLFVQGENDPGYLPESDNHWTRDPGSAVQSLGYAIDTWCGNQYDLPESEQNDELSYAEGLSEIMRGARCAEYGDIVAATINGGVSYTIGDRAYWINMVQVTPEQAREIMGCRCEDAPCCGCDD